MPETVSMSLPGRNARPRSQWPSPLRSRLPGTLLLAVVRNTALAGEPSLAIYFFFGCTQILDQLIHADIHGLCWFRELIGAYSVDRIEDFLAVNRDRVGCLDAKPDLVAADFDHGHPNIVVDHD